MRSRDLARAAILLPLALTPSFAHAQVTEPNGVEVPNLAVPNSTETTLQDYFDAQMEAIDAVAEASVEPSVFSPQCNFSAALVLNEGSPSAGISWYNVPTDPMAAPAAVYPVVPPGTMLGQVVSSADIRMHPDYAGGLVGFALVKTGFPAPIYYSEQERNAECTNAATCPVGGHWKMMLAYRSKSDATAYYLAFEDWEGANASGWQGNDGDFNDQVFRISGVSCAGGGEPCDTGKQGLCATGLTDCQPGGELACRQQVPERPETCDDVDNDCNGVVDDGELCPVDEVCVRGQCVASCSTGEFRCPVNLACDDDGFCVDPACLNVQCDPGSVCRGGDCVSACGGVVCPLGQVCQLGTCIDLCANVTCETGNVCDRGVCVGHCSCSGCPDGEACSPSGRCVDPGCESVECAAGQGCVAGACADACAGAVCPGGAACTNGACDAPPITGSGGGSNAGNGGGGGIVIGNGGQLPGSGTGSGATSGSTGSGNASNGAGGDRSEAGSGCGCRVVSSSTQGNLVLLGVALAAACARLRRRARGGAPR